MIKNRLSKANLPKLDQLIYIFTGLFVILIGLYALPVDLTTRLTLVFSLATLMFTASTIYFVGLTWQFWQSSKPTPLALKSLTLLSALALASTLVELLQVNRPTLSVGIVFLYAGVFLYTSVKGDG